MADWKGSTLEFGLYYYGPSDAPPILIALRRLLEHGFAVSGAVRIHQGPDIARREFRDVYDERVTKVDCATPEDIKRIATASDARLVSIELRRADVARKYFLTVISTVRPMVAERHPVALWTPDPGLSGPDSARGRRDARRAAAHARTEFTDLVERLLPAYAVMTVDWPIPGPDELASDAVAAESLHDLYLANDFLGHDDMARVAEAYERAGGTVIRVSSGVAMFLDATADESLVHAATANAARAIISAVG